MAALNLAAKSEPFAIGTLITARSHELGLSKARIVRLAGYKNEAKGIRRLDSLIAGDLETTRALIQGLPAAFNLPTRLILVAVEQTRQQIAAMRQRTAEQADAAWRAAFKPHAIILTERRIPSPIFVVAVIGAERLLRVDFDAKASPVSFVKLALEGLKQKTAEWGNALPGYGRPTGFVVNYRPDFGVRFNLDGSARETFDKAYRVGEVSLLIKGQPVPPGMFTGSLVESRRRQ
jgi:hypothetical protein